MTIYYKATRPDGTDFYNGTVDYAAICGTGESLPELPGGDVCTNRVYHASDVATETLIGGSWPCRLFEVEGLPTDQRRHKFGFATLAVVCEVEAHRALGPNGEAVAELIERASELTGDEVQRLAAAWDAARYAARDAARYAARYAAWDAAWDAARDAARDAALALVVRDLITDDQFNMLYGPWRDVIEGGQR